MHRITEAENSLEFLNSVLDGMVDMVRVIDEDCNVVMINDQMRRVLGTQVGGKCYSALGGAPCANCVGGKARTAGRVFQKKAKLGDRWYSVMASPLKRPDGAPWCVEVWRDMTHEYAVDDALRQRDEKMKQELAYARRLQWNMLPKRLPAPAGYRFFAQYKPCEELSGDFYDAFALDDQHIAFYIADVAGHGVPAALLTVFIARLIRAEMDVHTSPAQILTEATARFSEMGFEEQMYITAVVGVLSLPTGEVTWCNAGHSVPPIVFGKEGPRELMMPGLPVCRWKMEQPRRNETFILSEGEKIMLYTDGLEGMWNDCHEETFLQGAARIVRQGYCENAPRDLWREASAGTRREPNAMRNDDTAILLICREEARP
ncbi:MAG: SpoIIE family protein phosphatase [Eubacteriales bacterium]|nr:SpoIIE family protein phosphatase [Eubacteriales bacterium]